MVSTNSLQEKFRKRKSSFGYTEFCQYPIDLSPEQLTARQFCRKMFGMAGLPEAEAVLYENQCGYRGCCIELLSTTLGVDARTVRNWGGTLDFEKMPYTYRRILGIVFERLAAIKQIHEMRNHRIMSFEQRRDRLASPMSRTAR